MLGALRDEVVPEVLGGKPAEPQDPPEDAAADGGQSTAEQAGEDSTGQPGEQPVDDAGVQATEAGDGDALDADVQAAVTTEASTSDAVTADTGTAVADTAPADAVVGDTGDVTPTPTATDASVPATHDAAPVEASEPAAPVLDELCASAVDLARAAAVEEAGSAVGEHLGVEPEDAQTATHSFATTDPAYRGWRWAVTVARAAGTDTVTVDEVVLLPGSEALLAPAWVPYSERVQPDDLGAGDLLPPAADDPRLVPSYADTDDDQALRDELFVELGLGRPRVLSAEGRLDAAERWHEGDTGPASPRALAAPGSCGDCGFLVPLGGSLRGAFGACANAQAPDDGRVVSLRHGCGAHSETPAEVSRLPVAELVVDEVEFEFEERPAGQDPDASEESLDPPADPLPDPAEESQAEELGHS